MPRDVSYYRNFATKLATWERDIIVALVSFMKMLLNPEERKTIILYAVFFVAMGFVLYTFIFFVIIILIVKYY